MQATSPRLKQRKITTKIKADYRKEFLMRKIQNIISIFMLGTFLGVLLVILSMNAACSPLKYEDFENGDFKYRL